jgi:hypothetical protein
MHQFALHPHTPRYRPGGRIFDLGESLGAEKLVLGAFRRYVLYRSDKHTKGRGFFEVVAA